MEQTPDTTTDFLRFAAAKSLKISKEIQLILKGLHPEIQGAVLADLVSLFLAGHNPKLREEVMAHWLDTMKKMIGPSEQELLERSGKENPWEN